MSLPGRLRDALASSAVPGIVSAYLFGSEAERRAHRESDVDVGVLLDQGRHPDAKARFEARLRLAGELARALGGREVDLVVLNDAPPLLARRILRDGLRLVGEDSAADRAFARRTIALAADLEPWLRARVGRKLDFASGG